MICPACKNAMIVVERNRIELDYCSNCGGTWFDAGELELLLARSGTRNSEGFLHDILARPEEHSSEESRRCPVCLEKMKKAKIGESAELLVDVCKQSHGIWLDSGELDSLLEKSDQPEARLNSNGRVVSEFLGDIYSARHEKNPG